MKKIFLLVLRIMLFPFYFVRYFIALIRKNEELAKKYVRLDEIKANRFNLESSYKIQDYIYISFRKKVARKHYIYLSYYFYPLIREHVLIWAKQKNISIENYLNGLLSFENEEKKISHNIIEKYQIEIRNIVFNVMHYEKDIGSCCFSKKCASKVDKFYNYQLRCFLKYNQSFYYFTAEVGDHKRSINKLEANYYFERLFEFIYPEYASENEVIKNYK